ncbi:9248_t:CDS:1 [Diversispora eburnea]|uniref:9248_t:CDS:1 n=1 Tax=Diversispora eburnea TaxID=1213867 RepID=A0A9N9GMS3_9GLOM|nr:9248_t:CDS:1 [Diversispora eburnea]
MLELTVHNITTVLWFVGSDIRVKASYERQARFIESLAQYNTGNVWDNTTLVIEGTSDTNSQGPRDAAREITQEVHRTNDDLTSNISKFKIWLFERLPPESIYVKVRFSSDQINEYGVFKESEPERILARYESLMKGRHENPIRINLRKVKCSKCPEKTDPRLALPECHSEMEYHYKYIHYYLIIF